MNPEEHQLIHLFSLIRTFYKYEIGLYLTSKIQTILRLNESKCFQVFDKNIIIAVTKAILTNQYIYLSI